MRALFTTESWRAAWMCALLLVFSGTLGAADLEVDRTSVQENGSLTVTVTLDNEFAGIDDLQLPLKNLIQEGPPSVSTQYLWVNGAGSNKKILRYIVRPVAPGPALIGPVVLHAGGLTQTLRPLAVQVLPDAAAKSNDPPTILRELLATGRDPLFLVASADRTEVFEGEEVVVTWTLYNGVSIQQWQLGRQPKLSAFWTEELDVMNETSSQEPVGEQVLLKVPVRRAALFPTHSGSLDVGSQEGIAAVMRRSEPGPFGYFEGNVVEVRYTSAPLTIQVKPIPPGPPVDGVGDVKLTCGSAEQKNGGPVSFLVTLEGRANLRAFVPPHLDGPVGARVEVTDRGVTVNRRGGQAVMTRRWQYFLFPSASGTLRIPPVVTKTFSPSSASRSELRCAGASLVVTAASNPVSAAPLPPESATSNPSLKLWLAGIVGAALLALAVLPSLRRRSARGRLVAQITRHATPTEAGLALDTLLHARGLEARRLLVESSDRGDSYRAVRSLLEALEHDRIPMTDSGRELEQRVRDLLSTL